MITCQLAGESKWEKYCLTMMKNETTSMHSERTESTVPVPVVTGFVRKAISNRFHFLDENVHDNYDAGL